MSCAYNRRSKLMLSVNCSTLASVGWLNTPDQAFFDTSARDFGVARPESAKGVDR
jgi:hypothetical protein